MKIMLKLKEMALGAKRFVFTLSLPLKILLLALIASSAYYAYSQIFSSKTTTTVKTTNVRKGTLTSTITASGQVASTNNSPVTTLSSGVVSRVYVSNGTIVQAGDKIAEIDLDQSSKQRYAQALASYQSAKNSVESAKSRQLALQAAMFGKWDTFKELAESGSYTNSDSTPNYANRALPEFHIPEKEWLAAEADYKNQTQVITQAQNALNSAWLSLNEASPIIYAPISGSVTGLSLQEGSVISSSTTTSTTTTSKNQVAHIVTQAQPTIAINVTEIDVTKIAIGQDVSIIIDAFPNKKHRGTVLSVDTVGTTTSGVTNYPTVISVQTESQQILPNMSATATILIAQKKDALIIPLSAVTTKRNQSTVKVKKNGVISTLKIETGLESDTEVEVTSGLSEGDTLVLGSTTSSTASGSSSSSRTSSPFSPVFGGRR